VRLDAIVSRSPVLMLLRVTVNHVTDTQRNTQSCGPFVTVLFYSGNYSKYRSQTKPAIPRIPLSHSTLSSISCVAGWYRLRFLCSVAPLVLHFIESHLEGHVIIDGMRDDGYHYVVAAACEHVGENE